MSKVMVWVHDGEYYLEKSEGWEGWRCVVPGSKRPHEFEMSEEMYERYKTFKEEQRFWEVFFLKFPYEQG